MFCDLQRQRHTRSENLELLGGPGARCLRFRSSELVSAMVLPLLLASQTLEEVVPSARCSGKEFVNMENTGWLDDVISMTPRTESFSPIITFEGINI